MSRYAKTHAKESVLDVVKHTLADLVYPHVM